MGVVNVTPDSFSDRKKFMDSNAPSCPGCQTAVVAKLRADNWAVKVRLAKS